MRYLLLSLFLTGFVTSSYAQPITGTFEQAKSNDISFSKLDSAYPSAAHANPSKGVFKDDQKEFLTKYRDMMREFGNFLQENDFDWEEQVSFFQRIYFNNDGTIDYYFVNLDETNLSEEKKEQFKNLLHEFSNDYQFSMEAESNFAQCAPITFVDPPETNKNSKN